MKEPIHISEVMHQLIRNEPQDPYTQLLRRCPLVQLEMLRQGYMDWDELTPEEQSRLAPFINPEDLRRDD